MGRLQGKVGIVLGAATPGNIGQEIARRFAQEGAQVMVSGRHKEALSELADEIGGAYALCDITVEEDLRELMTATIGRFGRVDIGVNCTGWGLLKPFLETTREDLEKLCALQYTGAFQLMQELVKAMSHGGSIIQLSTETATIMFESHAAYMGTKAGIDHVVRTVANEFGSRGIKANSISLGINDSPMAAAIFQFPAIIEAFRKEYPLGRLGTSADVAAAAVWLASDESFMSGENLHVSGGLKLRRNPTLAEIAAACEAAGMPPEQNLFRFAMSE
jgi:NAD(P)-dependent dehydrogenase (short-subunit alcohol dehydrogenase family)